MGVPYQHAQCVPLALARAVDWVCFDSWPQRDGVCEIVRVCLRFGVVGANGHLT